MNAFAVDNGIRLKCRIRLYDDGMPGVSSDLSGSLALQCTQYPVVEGLPSSQFKLSTFYDGNGRSSQGNTRTLARLCGFQIRLNFTSHNLHINLTISFCFRKNHFRTDVKFWRVVSKRSVFKQEIYVLSWDVFVHFSEYFVPSLSFWYMRDDDKNLRTLTLLSRAW